VVLQTPQIRPASSYEEALERVRAFQAYDDDRILPQARTVLLDCGTRTQLSVVLLHGFTNHPGQYREFAPRLFAHGVNVLVPRMPEQGDRNRMTDRLAKLTAQALLARASEAVDIACGLGNRVCVAGISSSGLLCAYFAQYRRDVARAIPISPVFALLQFPYWLSRLAAQAALVLPNAFVWWDPRLREHQLPDTAYPRFPTRALAQCLRVGDAVYAASGHEPLAAGSIVMMTNKNDPAVNNNVADRVVFRWRADSACAIDTIVFTDLPHVHDIIDPQNPQARIDIVYPRLLKAILDTPGKRP
jgi:alpha-beta hydrolase superfamily lysophospholipase